MTNLTELSSFLSAGATIITPNNRSAIELKRLLSNSVIQEQPLCFPYEVFLKRIYTELRWANSHINFPIILTPTQTQHLWSNILTEQLGAPLNLGLLEQIKEAWSRCQKWLLKTKDLPNNHHQQTTDFQTWAGLFEDALFELNATTSELLVNFFIESKLAPKASTFIWYCFDDYTPAQKALQNYLESQGSIIEHRDLPNSNKESFYLSAADESSEYDELKHWILQRYEVGDRSIAVVIPDLETKAQNLQRFFKSAFADSEIKFNISLGKSLADFPLVAHALCWLDLDNSWVSNHQINLLLYSPYLGYASSEMLARAEIWQSHPNLQETMVSRANLFYALKRTPKLLSLLETLKPYPEKASLDCWVQEFKLRLSNLGFPGEASLNSIAYQCYQKFLQIFDEFQALGFITEEFSKDEALTKIKTIARQSIFQAKKEQAEVQILGLLEASGCLFDSVWVTGMTSETFPEKTAYSAFLPIKLQKEKLMPHSCPNRELTLAKKIIERLKNSSPLAVFSYPKLTEAKHQLPCSLLLDLPEYITEAMPLEPSPSLEEYAESYTLPLQAQESIHGGTTLLANQAICPFKAFAAHRLHLKKGRSKSEGLDASERGQLTHKIMEKLWGVLETQEKLLELSVNELQTLVVETIVEALKPYKERRPYSFTSLIENLEIKRLTKLIHACLSWEKSRPPFKISALEQEFSYSLANLAIKVRVDRLDKVGDESWVIDYKTTLPSSSPWKEERPSEPQILVYALLDETISTLIFAGLKQGQISCKGLSAEKLGLAGMQTAEDWDTQRKSWQEQLTVLAQEFIEGEIKPEPKTLSVCAMCDYRALCRY